MFETPFTVVGNIVNDPKRRRVGDQEVHQVPGGQQFAAAHRRRQLGARATRCSSRSTAGAGWSPASAPRSGRATPVIVVGYVYTSEYEDREGVRRSSLEVRATSVGPDLARSIVRIEKPAIPAPTATMPGEADRRRTPRTSESAGEP